MDIATRILNKIKEKGVSYYELAKLTGIPKSALQRYAIGETTKIPLDRLEQIAKALGCSPAYLMGWEDEYGYSIVTEQDKEKTEKLPPRLETFLEAINSLPDDDWIKIMEYADYVLLKHQAKVTNSEDGEIIFPKHPKNVNYFTPKEEAFLQEREKIIDICLNKVLDGEKEKDERE